LRIGWTRTDRKSFYPSAPILRTDNDRRYREASVGAGKLLGLPREKIICRSLDDFTDPDFKPVISQRWRTFLALQPKLLEELERDHILLAFRETGGVVSRTVSRLGRPRTTLNAMMKKLGISRSDL